jgi:hypothetical protein
VDVGRCRIRTVTRAAPVYVNWLVSGDDGLLFELNWFT